MKLHIKNMVCPRCVMAVEKILADLDISAEYVRLGEIKINQEPERRKLKQLEEELQKIGFELLKDEQEKLVEKIKSVIISHIQHPQSKPVVFSSLLSKELHREYSQLSKLFSSVEGITIEQYIILQKIEKVKELILYGENNLSEIAFILGYSSVAHLSTQFRKVTGTTPSEYKKQQDNKTRKGLENI